METRLPQIRFKKYKENWQEEKLGDNCSVNMCRRVFKDQTSKNGDIPFYKIGTFGGRADAFISRELFSEFKTNYPYPKKGDVLLSASGSIGRTVVYDGEDAYFQDSNIVWLNHNNKFDNTFLKHFYSIVKWKGLEGSTIKRLYNETILNTLITFPCVEEQQTIGSFLNNVDNLVTLTTQKLGKIKVFKKSCLEKMFPQKKEMVPEIRFKGFYGPWEKRKLEELMHLGNGRDYKHLQYGNIPVYGTGGYMTSVNAFLSDKDSIGIGRKGTIDKPYILKAPFWTVDTLFYATPRNEVDLYYLYGLFQITDWKSKDESTGVPSLSKQNINEMELYSTSDILEQKKIGSFFAELDSLINLNQQKLDKLNNLKKTLLDKMLV